jgi:hypothetical protein
MATPNSTAQIAELLESVSNWGRWGKDDQRGALNYITSEKRVAAARLVQTCHAEQERIADTARGDMIDEDKIHSKSRADPGYLQTLKTDAANTNLTCIATDDPLLKGWS